MKYLLLIIAILFAVNPGERVTVMPEDGNLNYVSIMGQSGDAKFETLKAGLASNARLLDLQNHAHVSVLPAEGGMFKDRFAPTVTELPCVRVQNADGKVLYQASGAKAPASAQAMAEAVCPLCPNKPSPTPSPITPPNLTPIAPILDTPSSPLEEPDENWKVLVAAGAGIALGGYEFWKEKFAPKGGAK